MSKIKNWKWEPESMTIVNRITAERVVITADAANNWLAASLYDDAANPCGTPLQTVEKPAGGMWGVPCVLRAFDLI